MPLSRITPELLTKITIQRAKKVVSDSPGLVDFAIKMFLVLVKMTFGLVYSSFSLPEWQPLKMTFFALCSWSYHYNVKQNNV